MRASPPPHVARLLRRIRTLETPIVQLWGWPGSGKAALLEALLEAEGERAAALALADVGSEAGLRQAIDHASLGGARWLVAGACPAERLVAVARWLKPGQRLVFTTPRRQPAGALDCGIVGPEELLLERREIGALFRSSLGVEPPDAEAVRRLHEASDGWYRPLRLALEEDAAAAAAARGAEDLLELRAVRSFLRHEVLGSFAPEERELLAEPLPPTAERRRSGDRGTRLAELLEERGMLVEDGTTRRPPRLLAAFLERARSRPGAVPRPAAAEPIPDRPGYVLRLLGEPTVSLRRGGAEGPPIVWRLKRSFKVLAYLASSPGLQASREDLVEALWPDEDEERIQKNFHPTLSHLRRALESGGEEPAPLVLRDGIYRLSPEIDWTIDLLELVRLVEEGRRLVREEPERAAEIWREAWGLYRGPFLQGQSETWISTRRESYQRIYLELLRELGDLLVQLERWAEAMDAYRAVLVEDPLQERVHVAVMRLYSREGRRDLVRRQYDRLASLLQQELGVTPLFETTREYHQLMG